MSENNTTKEDIEKDNEIFTKILNGKAITEVVETGRGNFTLKYPLQKEYADIIKKRIEYLSGLDISKLTEAEIFMYETASTLDIVIVEKPSWWTNALSVANVDFDLIMQIHRGYLSFVTKIQECCKRSDVGRVNREGDELPPTEDMGDGIFSSLTK